MKNAIRTITFLFIAVVANAQQDNWDTVTVDGFGVGDQISALYSYNGKVYAGCYQQGAGIPAIYESSTGQAGTWTTIGGLGTVASANDYAVSAIAASPAAPGKLFIGTDNYNLGGRIFRYDGGSSWTDFSSLPAPYDMNDNRVDKLLFYSHGGVNDSLYAFFENSTTGVQLWKTPVSAPNWQLVTQFNTAVQYVHDARVFNDTIYFTAFGYESYVYKVTDHNDTIRAHAATGINGTGNCELTSLGTFHGELVVGCRDYNGSHIWKLAAGNNWVELNGDGFGNNGTVQMIRGFEEINGTLWILDCGYPGAARYANGSIVMGGPTTAYAYSTNDGVNFHRSSMESFNNVGTNAGDSYVMTSMGNHVFAGGPTYGSQPSLFHLGIPVASFTDPSTACELVSLNFINTSQNYSGSEWFINGVSVSTSQDANYTFTPAGTYTVTLVVNNGFVSDTATHTFVVGPAISNLQLNMPYGTTICQGNTFWAYGTVTGGTAPFTYLWNSGGTLPNFSMDTLLFAPSASDSYTVSVTDAFGCAKYNFTSVTVTASTTLTGTITGQLSGPISSGLVYLFRHQPGSAALDTVFPVANISTGTYSYAGLTAGSYLLKAIADTAVYPNALSTYYGNEYIWDSSLVYVHGCVQTDTANIQVIEVAPMTGNAIISGYVAEGPGYGQKLIGGHDHIMVPGGPIRGVDVKLGKNPGGSAAARTFTDTNGYYQFNNVDPGTYRIYVDIPNLPMDSTRQVVVTALDSSLHNDYFVDSARIYIIDSSAVTGIYSTSHTNEENFGIYPNPSSGKASVSYELKQASVVLLEIYDMIGEKKYSVNKGLQQEGKYLHGFDAKDLDLRAGVYMICLRVNNKVSSQRIVVVER